MTWPRVPGCSPSCAEIGHREPDLIAHWFGDPNTYPLVIVKGNEPVGFARVLRSVASAAPTRIDYRMAEFFIARARRRLGIGRTAVQLILSRFAGRWEITEYLRNPSGGQFLAARGGRLHPRLLSGAHRQRRSAPGVRLREASDGVAPARTRRRRRPAARGCARASASLSRLAPGTRSDSSRASARRRRRCEARRQNENSAPKSTAMPPELPVATGSCR